MERAVDPTVKEQMVDRLLQQVDDVARGTQRLLVDEVPELRRDPRLLELLHQMIVDNLTAAFVTLRSGRSASEAEIPAITFEYARLLAQLDISSSVLSRSYRIGQQRIAKIAIAEILNAKLDANASQQVIDWLVAGSFDYIDRASEQALAAYNDDK